MIRGALLAKAEALLVAGDAEACVVWDPVQSRAVRLVSGPPRRPLPVQLWTALYAAEAEAWETPRLTAHSVPSRVARGDPYGLGGMPSWEKAGVAALCGVEEETRFGRTIVYLCERTLRVEDNRALQYAHRLGRTAVMPVVVVAFSGGEEDTPSGTARVHCLASFRQALAGIGIPLLCFAGPFCEQVVGTYLRECVAHVAVCDWAPGPQPVTEALVRARICPVICFDSTWWCLRAPNATAETIAELCADYMREGRALDPLPALGELSPVVQEMLLCEGSPRDLFVPAAIVRPRATLPLTPWRYGVEAARAELARCIAHLKSGRGDNVGVELRDGTGPWALLRHVEVGGVAPAACLRALLSAQVAGPQQRRAFQVLVWGRERSVLWWMQQRRQLPALPAPCVCPEWSAERPSSEDALCNAAQERLMRSGQLHPLLLGHWLAGLPPPRLDCAQRLLRRWASGGWSFETESAVRWELSLGEPRPLEVVHRTNLIHLLRK